MKVILIKGLLVSLKCPSPAALTVTVDACNLSDAELNELKNRLNSTIQEIELNYSGKPTRRMIRILWNERPTGGKGLSSTSSKKKTAIVQFIPYPARIVNAIESIRVQAYQAINTFGYVAQRLATGDSSRVLYLLPYTNVASFYETIDELNKKLAAVREDAERILIETDNFKPLRAILDEFDHSPQQSYKAISDFDKVIISKRSTNYGIDDIKVAAYPISLEPNQVIRMIDDMLTVSVSKVVEEDEKARLTALKEIIHSSILNTHEDIASTLVESVEANIREVVYSVLSPRTHEQTALRRLGILERSLEGLGLLKGKGSRSDKEEEDDAYTVLEKLRKIVRTKGTHDRELKASVLFGTTEKEKIADMVVAAILS